MACIKGSADSSQNMKGLSQKRPIWKLLVSHSCGSMTCLFAYPFLTR